MEVVEIIIIYFLIEFFLFGFILDFWKSVNMLNIGERSGGYDWMYLNKIW